MPRSRGSGIGTSATRAEILKKLVNIQYLMLNAKTQVITPTLLWRTDFEVVNVSIRQLLNPDLTASWEKGLTYVAEGSITSDEYVTKLENFRSRTGPWNVLRLNNQFQLRDNFDAAAVNYNKPQATTKAGQWQKEGKQTMNKEQMTIKALFDTSKLRQADA